MFDDALWLMRTMALWLMWLAVLTGATALTVLVSRVPSPEAEADLIRLVQAWPVPGTPLAHGVRALTTTELVLVVGAAVVVRLWRAGARHEARTLAVLCLALPVVQTGLKLLVDRPRPDAELVRASFHSPSFPAGHVLSPVVVYGALVALGLVGAGWRRGWRLAAGVGVVLLLASSGLANVYLGVHWPTDVLGGYLWGVVLLLPAVAVLARRPDRATGTGHR